MAKKIFIVIIILISIPVCIIADEENLSSIEQICIFQAVMAVKVMEARQAGIASSEVLALEFSHDSVRDIVGFLVFESHAWPIQRSEKKREESVLDFRDHVFDRCIRIGI